MNVIVMGGLGQVGAAISELLSINNHIVHVLDKASDFNPRIGAKYDFLHVTIPYSDTFVSSVKRAVAKYDPKFVIIHSTVPVGTTRSIGSYAAHSPVRGQHDKLVSGLKMFVKYVGCRNEKTRNAVRDHLKSLLLNVECWNNSDDTELMKLLCLSRYLNDLAYYEIAYKTCKKFNVAPIRVVQWTNTYNDGYATTRYRRPELTFPMGKAGGHCVVPVSKILANQTCYKWFKRNLDVFVGNK